MTNLEIGLIITCIILLMILFYRKNQQNTEESNVGSEQKEFKDSKNLITSDLSGLKKACYSDLNEISTEMYMKTKPRSIERDDLIKKLNSKIKYWQTILPDQVVEDIDRKIRNSFF